MFKILLYMVIFIFSAIMYGIVFPGLISAKDDFSVIFGLIACFVYSTGLITYIFNQITESNKGDNN